MAAERIETVVYEEGTLPVEHVRQVLWSHPDLEEEIRPQEIYDESEPNDNYQTRHYYNLKGIPVMGFTSLNTSLPATFDKTPHEGGLGTPCLAFDKDIRNISSLPGDAQEVARRFDADDVVIGGVNLRPFQGFESQSESLETGAAIFISGNTVVSSDRMYAFGRFAKGVPMKLCVESNQSASTDEWTT